MVPTNDVTTEMQPYAAWIGLDWADQKHYWSLRTADGKLKRGQLDNTPEAVEIWAAELAQQFGGRPVALALEQARGAVIGMLSKYAHIVLFPVHSTTLANYRQTFAPSGAKGDPTDADLILDLLAKHPERLRPLQPDTVETRSLQFLTEERRKLVDQHTSESQRLINWLKQVSPRSCAGSMIRPRQWWKTCCYAGRLCRNCRRFHPKRWSSSSSSITVAVRNGYSSG